MNSGPLPPLDTSKWDRYERLNAQDYQAAVDQNDNRAKVRLRERLKAQARHSRNAEFKWWVESL